MADDSGTENESNTVDKVETGSNSNDTNDTNNDPVDDKDENNGEESSVSSSPFDFISDIRDLTANIDPEAFKVPNIPTIDLSALQNLRQPVLNPEVIDVLSQPVVSPDVLKALNQPAIDPGMLDAMSQPAIDPDVIEALTQPAIEPALLDAIQAIDQSQILEMYKSAAALEQIEQQSANTGEQDFSTSEAPESGGFLSDFFNFTTWYLLNTQGLISDETERYAIELLETENVRLKAQQFAEIIRSLGEKGRAAATLASQIGIQVAYVTHFAQNSDNDHDSED